MVLQQMLPAVRPASVNRERPAVELDQAARLIKAFTGSVATVVTFQTFSDRTDLSPDITKKLRRVLHGTLNDVAKDLTQLNGRGAGVFFTENETDLTGRKASNIVRVRAVCLDFDDADAKPLKLIGSLRPEPHIVVETSPGKYHAHWLVSDCELDQFTPLQKELAARFGGDEKIHDLSRVMRLPGFVHQKGDPYLTRIVNIADTFAYTVTELRAGLLPRIGLAVQGSEVGHGPTSSPTAHVDSRMPSHKKAFNRLEGLQGVPEGDRDTMLFRLACSYRAKGWAYEEAEVLVLDAAANCTPPFPEAEALQKLEQAWKYPAGNVVEKLTELGNARRFVARHGSDWRWVTEFKNWVAWDGQRWLPNQTDSVMRAAKETSMSIYSEVASAIDSNAADAIAKHAARSQTLRALNSMIILAQSEPDIPLSQGRLDQNHLLLGVNNGTVDLSTGQLRAPLREDYITQLANVSYDKPAGCPVWRNFLLTAMGGNVAMVEFLQRAIGYSLTGDTSEQCLFFLFGIGRNGKTTFLGAVTDLLGDYAAQCASETLMMKSRDGGANNDIARLRGARFVSSIEAEDGKRLAESLVKQLTGGDTIVARFLFKEHFEFRPQFKIWFAANHKPIIRGDDLAIWRRIQLIPFSVTVADDEVDKGLSGKLAAERSGILNWAIEGCLEWQRRGLCPPAEVIAATEAYRGEMDIIGAWLEECCVVKRGAQDGAKRLYDSYRAWCDDAGAYALSSVKFALKLAERGFTKMRSSTGQVYHGVALIA